MKIPKVSLDILQSTTMSIEDGSDFWKNAVNTMFEENPLLYQLLIVSEVNDNKPQEFLDGYTRGASLIYILLSRQAEADDMNESWG